LLIVFARASFRKGWDLMSCLVVTFPPSKDFEAYLHRFLQDHINEPEDEIAQMALYCLSKLVIIARKGPRGKVPTIQEIERAIVRLTFIMTSNYPIRILNTDVICVFCTFLIASLVGKCYLNKFMFVHVFCSF
jgi:hypothetical protein